MMSISNPRRRINSTFSLLTLASVLTLCGSLHAQADTDNDGILDDVDNCVMTANPGQENSDLDAFGNAGIMTIPRPRPSVRTSRPA